MKRYFSTSVAESVRKINLIEPLAKLTKAKIILSFASGSDNKVDEGESTFDKNIEQVKNIFRVIIQEIENITEDCGFSPQIVVMEHADEKEFYQHVKKRWDNQGEKLI